MSTSQASKTPYRAPINMENVNQIPREILKVVKSEAKRGDPDDVLRVMDDYAHNVQATICIGDVKGPYLDKCVADADPMTSLELGSYYGYGTIRIARLLKPGGKLYTVEFNSDFAEVVKEILEHSGLSDKVTVIHGSSSDVIPTIAARYGLEKLDFVFIDHFKEYYKVDLDKLEETGLFRKGTVLVADNVIRPGCPAYTDYVRNSKKYKSELFEASLGHRPDLVDGVERSVYLGE